MSTELHGVGTHRLVYKAQNFTIGLTVTAYIWNPSLTKSTLQTFTEVSDGLYYLDYAFDPVGTYFGKFYEGGVATVVGTFRVVLAALTAAQVNNEVVDCLNVDTYAQPGQDSPPATTTIVRKLGDLHKSWRNKKDNDGTTSKIYADDATTVDQKSTVSAAAGVVTKGEMVSGP